MENIKKNLIQHMETFCLKCGTRHCGSEGERMAADYMVEYLTGLGIPVVREEFPTRGWKFESIVFHNVTKDRPVTNASACFFSGSVDWEGKLLFIESWDLEKLAELPVAGQVCFIKHIDSVFVHNRIAQELEDLGAAAAIFVCGGIAVDAKVVRNSHLQRIALATTDAYGAYEILDNPNDTYRLQIKAHSFDQMSCNVVARLGKGSVKGVIGGHYDTAPLVQGANDNAAGTITVLELARLMKDEDLDMTLDFVAFSGEEYMADMEPMGSSAYIRAHKGEDIRWLLNSDGGGDDFCRRFVRIGLGEKLPPVDHGFAEIVDAPGGGDNVPFCKEGIPCIWPTYRPYLGVLHTEFDSIERINYDFLTETTLKAYTILQQLVAGTKTSACE